MIKIIQKIYLFAGIYGILVILPQFFTEGKVGTDFPPVVTHPEFYYGFVGVAFAWQICFLIISRDPVRYKLIMIPGILEKAAFGIADIILFSLNRIPSLVMFFGTIDLIIMCLFIFAYTKTPNTIEL